MTRVGHLISFRRSSTSTFEIAWQQPTNPATGVFLMCPPIRAITSFGSPERLREPARERSLDERVHSLRSAMPIARPTSAPHWAAAARWCRRAPCSGRTRVLQSERLADHSAHRQPDPVRLLDAERVEKRFRVVGELIERIRSRRRARPAVTSRVVAQHLELRDSSFACSSHIVRLLASECDIVSQGPSPSMM